MKAAMPIVMRAMIGIMPFFIGYVFLGLCLFWQSSSFNCPSNAVWTLFAMMNGDSLTDTFQDVSYTKFFLGTLYMYSFVFVSIW